MPFLGKLENIDTAIANLDLKEGTLKAQLVQLVRARFPDQESLELISVIPAEDLIQALWQTDDPQEIQNKRKNLSGLKSSVNKSLKELIPDGKNPDGIVIGRDNTFTIAEEQKDQLIKQLGITPESIHSMRDMLNAFKKLLLNIPDGQEIGDIHGLLDELEETRKLMETRTTPTGGPATGAASGGGSTTDEDEGAGGGGEVAEVVDETEIVEVEEVEEVEEAGTIAGDDGPAPHDGGDDEPLEEVFADQILDADASPTSAAGEEGPGEAGDLDETEIVEVEEIEEVEEAGTIAGDDGPAPHDGGDDEPLEEVFADQLIDADDSPTSAASEEGPGGAGDLDETEIVEVEEIEEVEEAGTLAGDDGPAPHDGGDDEPLEEVFADQILDADDSPTSAAAEEGPGEAGDLDETEIVEEAELTEERAPELLEALSKYIDTEAETGGAEYLTEGHDEYVAQLLARFMPKFIKIPPGSYLVGSRYPGPIEQPWQRIALAEFHVGQFPVVNDLFEIFVRETGYETDAERRGYGNVQEGRLVSHTDQATGRATLVIRNGATMHRVAGANWRYPHGPGSSIKGKHNHPVVQISYEDALAFAAWAGKRLTTEEEWEAAARGTDDRLFPWGNTWLTRLGNFEASALGDTTPVNRFAPEAASPFGIHDLLGNVYEWTATLYRPATAAGQPGRRIHILKGGCWSSRGAVTIGHRMIEKADYWSNIIGFRCAV